MQKFEKDGKVAVLVSGGFGAGWSTWNSGIPECLFDPEVVEAVLSGGKVGVKAQSIAESKWPDGYWGGAAGLRVRWLDRGTRFRIEEYDGNESLFLFDDYEFITA